MNLLDAFKQYIRDAMPGGALNPEVTTQGVLDAAALGTAPVPVLGDAIGLAADVKRLKDNPKERTPANFALAGLGVLPFVPGMAGMTKAAKAIDALRPPQADALETARKNAVTMLGLPPNNTPMDRAKALGFVDDGLLHGTVNDFPAFAQSSRHSVYATDTPAIADIYATATGRHKGLREVNAGPNVIPLMSRGERLEVSDFRDGSGGWSRENLAEKLGGEVPSRGMWKVLPKHGYQSAKVEMDDLGGRQVQYIFPDPTVLRSRFAAFDPARINENDLLGRADLKTLGLLAGGSGALAYTRSEREKKKEK